MKKNIAIISAIAAILLAGCSPRANEEGENSQVQNSSENSTFSSENSENSNSNLTNDFSSSSSYLNNNNYSSNNNNFKPDSGSSSELSSQSAENSSSLSSSSSSTPAQSSSSTQSSSQKPTQSSSSKTTQSSSSKPASSTPTQGAITSADLNGWPTDENGCPLLINPSTGAGWNGGKHFIDQNGVLWNLQSGKWRMNGTGGLEEAAPPTHDHGDTTVPGAY